MRIFSKILAVIVFSILTFLALSPLGAALGTSSGGPILVGVLVVVALLAWFAPTARRAWGRGALIAGAAFIAMPLGMMALAGRVGHETVSAASGADAGAAAVGATLAGGVMVGASMILGFIVGAILLILGLVLALGGRREVIVVERR